MGTSTNGILFFGFDFCNEDEGDELPFDDWEDHYAEKMGLIDDSGYWTDEGDHAFPPGPERDAAEKRWHAYLDKKTKLVKKAGVEIDSHCSGEYPIYYVCTQQVVARRGYPEKLKLEEMEVTEEEIQKLRAFCELMGIKWKKPSWVLASYWG